tara:strand:- start:449 stop:1741 length:1293 start_codon:yes stop_codon:yes gene_type:complete
MKKISDPIDIWNLADRLFPICRSITGQGVRDTLNILSTYLPNLKIYSVKSGYKAFDWTVPHEWNVRSAFIEDRNSNKILDFSQNNLHLVGYSQPVDKFISLNDLQEHLYSLEDQPDAIPYVTSYYKSRWGFCLSHNQRKLLNQDEYRVHIDSDLKPGVLNYGELFIPGKTNKEIFLSTYVCHPSMANNELSGPTVTTALAQWLSNLSKRHYSYRIVFIPETIGSIVYLSKKIKHLKKNVIAGFNITCIGDERSYSFLPSRDSNTLADRAAKHVLSYIDPNFKEYKWQDRGSDERQYCAPGVDLPVASIMRSKYGEYPEYHTSLDDMNLITPNGLYGGFNAIKQAIIAIENNFIPKNKITCEPNLGNRGLYPTISTKHSSYKIKPMMNLLTYADGKKDLIEIASIIGSPISQLIPIAYKLSEHNLIQLNRT